MAFAFALDPTTPAGGEAASLGDDRIREFKNAVTERVNSRFVDVNSDPWIIKSPASGGNTQSLIPITDSTYVLGTAALRFSEVHSLRLAINTTVGTGANRINLADTSSIAWANADHITFTSPNLYFKPGAGGNTIILNGSGSTIITITEAGAVSGVASLDVTGNTRTGSAGGNVILTIGANPPAADNSGRLIFQNSNASHNWQVSHNALFGDTFEITPSTAVGGSTFTTPQLRITAAGTITTIGNQFTVGGNTAGAKTLTIYSADNNPALELRPGGAAADPSIFFYDAASAIKHSIDGNQNNFYIDYTGIFNWRRKSDSVLMMALSATGGLSSLTTIAMNGAFSGATTIAMNGAFSGATTGTFSTSVSITGTGAAALDVRGDAVIAATKRLYLDGSGGTGGNSYILESAADQISVVAGGVTNVVHTASVMQLQTGIDLVVVSGRKIMPDGGGDTYILESSANVLEFQVTSQAMTITSTLVTVFGRDFVVPATKRIYPDGGGDTYIVENAANHLQVFVGTSILFELGAGTAAGDAYFPTLNSAAAANAVYISTPSGATGSGRLTYVVSSMRYKQDIKSLSYEDAARTIFGSRPVTYHSSLVNDDSGVLYTGFIAEEMFEVGRQYVYAPDDIPESVDYARLTVPLTLIAQNHEDRLKKLEAQVYGA